MGVRMKRMALAALLFLTACGSGDNLYAVEDRCGANQRPFPDTWGCVKATAASLPGPADLKMYYFRTGDLVAERIREGTLTEAEGRMVMADALTTVMSQDAARAPAGGYYRPVVYQRMGPQTTIGY